MKTTYTDRHRAYYIQNRQNILAKSKESYEKNPDKYKAKTNKWRENNREDHLSSLREWYRKNGEKVRADNLEHYRKNREKRIAQMREHHRKNHEQYAEKRLEYYHDHLKLDSVHRIEGALRRRVRGALKSNIKAGRTFELIGCTSQELRDHLQSCFKSGMHWSNYGEWHVDHIQPCASFDLADPQQQRRCFNWRNLQPLWAADNMAKSAKYKSRNYRNKMKDNLNIECGARVFPLVERDAHGI